MLLFIFYLLWNGSPPLLVLLLYILFNILFHLYYNLSSSRSSSSSSWTNRLFFVLICWCSALLFLRKWCFNNEVPQTLLFLKCCITIWYLKERNLYKFISIILIDIFSSNSLRFHVLLIMLWYYCRGIILLLNISFTHCFNNFILV